PSRCRVQQIVTEREIATKGHLRLRSAKRQAAKQGWLRSRRSVMIIGAHSIVYSKDPDADRAFLRDVLNMPNVDVGGGWLIFGLPPAEVAIHPSKKND